MTKLLETGIDTQICLQYFSAIEHLAIELACKMLSGLGHGHAYDETVSSMRFSYLYTFLRVLFKFLLGIFVAMETTIK